MSKKPERENGDAQTDTQEKESNEKIKSGIRFARFFLILIMVLSVLIILFSNGDKISVDNFKRFFSKMDVGYTSSQKIDKSMIEFDYDSDAVVEVYKDGVARVTSDSLSIIDNMGTQFQNVLTGFTSPALITNQKYVLAFDRGGNKLIVTNSFSVLFEKTFDDNIVDVSMNSNGYFAVITQSEAYKNKIIVYNSDFKEIYKINSMSRYIVAVDISSNNKSIAISAMYTKDNNIIPQIQYYKLSSEENVWSVDFEGNVAVSVTAKDDGTVCALFEWGVCILDSGGREKYRHEFGNKILQCCYIDKGRYNIVVLSESMSGNSEIYVFNNNGKKVADIITDYEATSLDLNSERIAVASFDKLYVYTATGRALDVRDNPNDGMQVMFSGKNSVITVNSSNIVYNVLK